VRQVHPDELHAVWPLIKDGLEKVKARCHEVWIAEDVYASIKTGASTLHLKDDGFLVLTPTRQAHTGKPVLHVWIAYSAGSNQEEGETYLDRIAKQYGFQLITMKSPRRGWERRGWFPACIEYQREVK